MSIVRFYVVYVSVLYLFRLFGMYTFVNDVFTYFVRSFFMSSISGIVSLFFMYVGRFVRCVVMWLVVMYFFMYLVR